MRNYFIPIVLLFGAPLAFGDEMGDYMVDEGFSAGYDAQSTVALDTELDCGFEFYEA